MMMQYKAIQIPVTYSSLNSSEQCDERAHFMVLHDVLKHCFPAFGSVTPTVRNVPNTIWTHWAYKKKYKLASDFLIVKYLTEHWTTIDSIYSSYSYPDILWWQNLSQLTQ